MEMYHPIFVLGGLALGVLFLSLGFGIWKESLPRSISSFILAAILLLLSSLFLSTPLSPHGKTPLALLISHGTVWFVFFLAIAGAIIFPYQSRPFKWSWFRRRGLISEIPKGSIFSSPIHLPSWIGFLCFVNAFVGLIAAAIKGKP